jgi:hypothetical protein
MALIDPRLSSGGTMRANVWVRVAMRPAGNSILKLWFRRGTNRRGCTTIPELTRFRIARQMTLAPRFNLSVSFLF